MALWRVLPRGADLSRSLAGVATLLSNELPLGGVVLLHLDMQVLRPRLVAEDRLCGNHVLAVAWRADRCLACLAPQRGGRRVKGRPN